MPPQRLRLLAALGMAAVAFGLYFSTLLPGQDLGDTASFQAIAGDHLLTPRQGYPLYFAITSLFVRAAPADAARATNLASAVAAALAVGVVVLIGAELGGTLAAGLVAGLLLAASYTFWSQAIIAEVYALHILVVSAVLLAILAWQRRPTLARLAMVFALYALGFCNHLSMVLLMPGLALFLCATAPDGPASMLRPRVILLAAGLAVLGATPYAWNFSALAAERENRSLIELLQVFWFDVTKSDWRANMVYGIPWSTLPDRFAMYWFDLRQQFGLPGAGLACAGLWWLLTRHARRGLLVLSLWAVNWAFAFTYNVGDVHVFYLPSHLLVALTAGCGAGWISGWTGRSPNAVASVSLSVALLAYPAWRAWDTYPVMDRSHDDSPTRFLDGVTAALDGRREILGADMNWQLHNGLDYYAKYTRPDITVFDVPGTLPHFPLLAWHNREMGRDIALTEGAAAMVAAAYGGLFTIERDARVQIRSLADRVATLAPGTSYVLTVMEPYWESPLDPEVVATAARRLGAAPGDLPSGRFVVMAGRVGERPEIRTAANTPFRLRAALAGHALDVRFECWLPADTIRRAGFGHVVVNRRHALTLDRGLSFVALDANGRPQTTVWAGGLYSPQARFIIRAKG